MRHRLVGIPARQVSQGPSRASMVTPVLAAAGVVILIFLGYEGLERAWLSDYGPESTRWLHLARGLTSSLVAALLVGWLMHRASASLQATTLSTSDWVKGARPVTEERSKYFIRWLIQLRWIGVLVATGLVIFVTATGQLSREMLWPIAATLAVLALLNIGYTSLINSPALNRFLLPMQAYVDLVFLAILLHFSGGIENPLWIVLVFHVSIAGIVLDRRQCYAVAATAAVAFATVAVGEASGLIDHHLLSLVPHGQEQEMPSHAGRAGSYVASMVAILTVTLFIVAHFVTTLGDRIRYDEGQLATLADRAIADRQLLEQALTRTETGLCVFDTDLNPLWKNERWETWFGQIPISEIRRVLEGGRQGVEISVSNGSLSIDVSEDVQPVLQLSAARLRDGEGNVSHVAVLVRDITMQKQAQSKMLRAEKLAAVGELAGHVAHEVNNPISIISAKSRILLSDRRSEFSDKVAEELAKITGLADRVAEVAQKLLSYCRQSPAVRQELDVRVPVREAIVLVQDRARQAGVRIEDHLDDGLPAIHANSGEIQQVFVNLLLNALDAMPDGGRVSVEAREESPGNVLICVQDDGIGIPKDMQQSVLEPFFTTKSDGKGTGLGLSVCDGVIRSYGGEITLESGPTTRGTRVKITLPALDQQRGWT